MEKIRERGPNFTDYEKDILLGIIVNSYFNVLENKKTDTFATIEKTKAWEEITEKFNAATASGSRSGYQLKTAYCNLKTKLRRQISDSQVAKQKVDNANTTRLLDLIKQHVTTPVENNLDVYSTYYNTDSEDLVETFKIEEEETKVAEQLETEERQGRQRVQTIDITSTIEGETHGQPFSNIPSESCSISESDEFYSPKRKSTETYEATTKRTRDDAISTKAELELQILSIKRREELQKLDLVRVQLKQEQEKLKLEQERVKTEQEKLKQEAERTKQEVIKTKILELQLNKACLNI